MTAKLIEFPKRKPRLESDPDLAAKAARGDRSAFAELVRRHQIMVRGMLRRLTKGNVADADDLGQAAFMQAWTQIGKYAGGTFRSWLCAIAYREFLQARRKTVAEQKTSADAEIFAAGYVQPAQNGVKQDLTQALAALPDAQRVAIVLCVGAGLSHAEASLATGWPLGTVKSHVTRGKQALRERLNDYGVA